MSDTPLPDVIQYLRLLPERGGSDMFFSVARHRT